MNASGSRRPATASARRDWRFGSASIRVPRPTEESSMSEKESVLSRLKRLEAEASALREVLSEEEEGV